MLKEHLRVDNYRGVEDIKTMLTAGDKKSEFPALVCELFGSNEDLYRRITEEMIVDEQAKRGSQDPNITRISVIDRILRSLDDIALDSVYCEGGKQMSDIDSGKLKWLNLLKQMKQE